MSITVRYKNHAGQTVQQVVPYKHADHVLLANHINCATVAKRYGQKYILILEADRAKNNDK